MLKRVISITKRKVNRGRNGHRGKKEWAMFYYNTQNKMACDSISFLKAMYYKYYLRVIEHKLHRACPFCKRKLIIVTDSKKMKVSCPFCSGHFNL